MEIYLFNQHGSSMEFCFLFYMGQAWVQDQTQKMCVRLCMDQQLRNDANALVIKSMVSLSVSVGR